MATTGTTIQKEIERLKKAKADIKASIIAKGGIMPDTALIGDYADIIRGFEDMFNVGNYNYKVAPIDVAGLKEINWNTDDINYLKYNTLIPKGEDVGDTYKVSDANKQIKITSISDISTYQDNTNFKYCPKFDTSNVTNMNSMFYGCSSLTSVPLFDTSDVTKICNMYYRCSSLTTLCLFLNLKTNLDISKALNLTHDSLMNVINKAADVTSSPKTLTLGTTNLSKLTDAEKAIATNKGWVLK